MEDTTTLRTATTNNMDDTTDSDSPSTSTRTDSTFKANLGRFAFSSPETPLRTSLRLRAKTTITVSSNSGLDVVTTPKKRKPQFSDSDDEEQTPTKRKNKLKTPKRGYASPEKYAHLSPLTDHLGPDLDVIFCGINPGCMSASKGHHFANPTNHFWRALHLGGLTPKLIPPSDDAKLPQLYSLGLTNLVARVSAEEAELSKDEMSQSVPALLEKIVQYKPRVLCFVGKGIWDKVEADFKKRIRQHGKAFDPSIPRVKTSRIKSEVKAEEDVLTAVVDLSSPVKNGKKKELQPFNYGPQPYKFMFEKESAELSTKRETLIFVMPSTSGRVVSHQLVDKVKLFSQLREMVGDIKQGRMDSSRMEVIPTDHDIRLKIS